MKRSLALLFVLLAPVLMGAGGGCEPEPKPRPLKIVAHDYCILGEKVGWSVDDTRGTITDIRRVNMKYACQCSRPKPSACPK